MRALFIISGIRKTLHTKAIFVASSWLFGLLASAYFVHQTTFASLMCSVLFLRISIFGLLTSLAIPLFLTYILLRFFSFYYVLPLVFLKAFSFMCCYFGITSAFGNAGWLVSGMVLFSDFFLVTLLLLQWFNAATGKMYSPEKYLVVYCILPIIVVCFDYLVVSPYAAMLLNY